MRIQSLFGSPKGTAMIGLAQKPEAAEEAELVERARRNDAHAIRLIMQRHNRRLYRIARSILRDDSEAEDALQEAYVRAFSHLDRYRGEARLGTWMVRIVMNEALGRLRRRRETVDLVVVEQGARLSAEVIPFPHIQLDPETDMAQREIRVLVERAIDELPEAFRTVLVARAIEGMSTEETAELFGIPVETVKTRLHRARRLVRLEIERQVGPVMTDAFPFAGRRCERLTERVLERLGAAQSS
jgi:RNA polymerase sigma-70 factor (ECF subfamily)